MTFKITVSYDRSTTLVALSDGVILAATRFSLLKADDDSVVATADVSDGSLTHDFSGIEDQSLVAAVQDLDGSGNPLGDAVKSEAFTPSAIIPSAPQPTYAPVQGVNVAAVAE